MGIVTNHRYAVGQACTNGHQVAGAIDDSPEFAEDYCSRCGAPTVSACGQCVAPLRGYFRGVLSTGWELGRYCYKCGEPYPWTAAGVAAGRELIDILQGLSEEERQALSAGFDDLIRDTPRTGVAAMRVKTALAKVGREGGSALRDILVAIATESAKKQMGL